MPGSELQTDLGSLVHAQAWPARTLAKRIAAALTPDSAPAALTALLAMWRTACANPTHDWRWSEAGVARVFAAFPAVAAPLLRPWLTPQRCEASSLPLVGLAIIALRSDAKLFDRALCNEIYCCPRRLHGDYGAEAPDIVRAEAEGNFDALAHWTLAKNVALANQAAARLRALSAEGQLSPALAVSMLASARRHAPFISAYDDAGPRFNDLLWSVAGQSAKHAATINLVLMTLHDPNPDLRITVAGSLAPRCAEFTAEQIEPLLQDEAHTVCYRAMAYFDVTGNQAGVLRALSYPSARIYAAQVICNWSSNNPERLVPAAPWDSALGQALEAHYAKWPDHWSELAWLLKAIVPVGCSPQTLRAVLPLLQYHDANTRNQASEAASATAARLPPPERVAAQRAIKNFYTIECVECGHKFNGWSGSYRTGIVLSCPQCRAPMLEHKLGWNWLGRNAEINRYKKLPTLMPYDSE